MTICPYVSHTGVYFAILFMLICIHICIYVYLNDISWYKNEFSYEIFTPQIVFIFTIALTKIMI